MTTNFDRRLMDHRRLLSSHKMSNERHQLDDITMSRSFVP